MATQNPLLPPGQYVTYNATTQDPRAKGPSPEERSVGRVRQSFTRGDGPYYQVVWNPGDSAPKSALYHADQLCAVTQQQATDIINQMNATGQFPAQSTDIGADFQQPNVPSQAATPSEQQPGMYSL